MALGDEERAMSALRKLVEEYPDSEYAPIANGEMERLRDR